MPNNGFKDVDSEASILRFLNETHRLHDSWITSVEFDDGRFVDRNGDMHCGAGSEAKLTLSFDSQIGKPPARFKLMFAGVSRFEYSHDATDDGLILSCEVVLDDGMVRFACNEWDSEPRPLVVAKSFKYLTVI